jgi:pyruvate/2-oxoacid:ferredoxin oxidoreductase alpha subunit
MVKPGIPAWGVWGDRDHRRNLISSIYLAETDLEKWNVHLNAKYESMKVEQRADLYMCDDAEVLLVACTTPARTAKGAVQVLRSRGIKAGLFRPVTVWPFPIEALKPVLPNAKRIVVVEASNGQLEDELKIALANARIREYPEIEHVRHYGGVLPQMEEVILKVAAGQEVTV